MKKKTRAYLKRDRPMMQAKLPEYQAPAVKNIEGRIRSFCKLCYSLYTGLRESRQEYSTPDSFTDKPEDG